MANRSVDDDNPFCSMLRAHGSCEVWTHGHDRFKFSQFGWRCKNNESHYDNKTLIGNWNEHRYDIREASKPQRLPSQYQYNFATTYNTDFEKQPPKVPESLKHLKERFPHAHPGHQPELDSDSHRKECTSWTTTSRVSYLDPKLRTVPVEIPEAPLTD